MNRRTALRQLLAACSALALPFTRAFAIADRRQSVQRIAFGSCIDQNAPQPIWGAILRFKPDAFVLLGDNIYSWTSNLDEKRADYAKLDAQPQFQALRRSTELLGTWDDNDYGKIDGGIEYEHKEMSKQAFLEFFRAPKDDPRRTREGIYASEMFGAEGQRVQILLLDTRSFRTALKKGDVDRPTGRGPYVEQREGIPNMLGEEQWKWLREELRRPAEVRIVASSIQLLAAESGYEGWYTFPGERARLLGLLRSTNANGVVVISGDRHSSEISRLPGVLRYPLYDVTASSLTRRRPLSDEPNTLRVGAQYFNENFGTIEIDWRRRMVIMATRDIDGK
ncbi:MAG: alkaline phosphatase family protein, partial [Deltaproteobacteria bacterium]|nr:alkaline phosphatase family protein [Deltaproteobacteria bacterium]